MKDAAHSDTESSRRGALRELQREAARLDAEAALQTGRRVWWLAAEAEAGAKAVRSVAEELELAWGIPCR